MMTMSTWTGVTNGICFTKMRITRRQLRKIICELTDAEKNSQGIGVDALKAFLLDDLFPKEKQMSIEDAIEQSEGSGFDSEDAKTALEEMIEAGELKEKDGKLELT